MTNEEKILILEERIAKLEKIEKRRKIWGWISFIFKLITTILLIIASVYAYKYASNLVNVYKGQMKQISEVTGSVKEIDNLNEMIDKLFPNR